MPRKSVDQQWCKLNSNPCPKCGEKQLYLAHKPSPNAAKAKKGKVVVWMECVCRYNGDIEESEMPETVEGSEVWMTSSVFGLWQEKTGTEEVEE